MRLRSLLFVPGDRSERFAKAAASGADAIILDLEDSVSPANKDAARSAVANYLAGEREVITLVRNVTAKDRVVFETDVAGLEWPGSVPSVSITRGALAGILLDACHKHGVDVRFGAGYVRHTAEPDGVTIELSTGEKARGRALIGADGVRSTVRSQLVRCPSGGRQAAAETL